MNKRSIVQLSSQWFFEIASLSELLLSPQLYMWVMTLSLQCEVIMMCHHSRRCSGVAELRCQPLTSLAVWKGFDHSETHQCSVTVKPNEFNEREPCVQNSRVSIASGKANVRQSRNRWRSSEHFHTHSQVHWCHVAPWKEPNKSSQHRCGREVLASGLNEVLWEESDSFAFRSPTKSSQMNGSVERTRSWPKRFTDWCVVQHWFSRVSKDGCSFEPCHMLEWSVLKSGRSKRYHCGIESRRTEGRMWRERVQWRYTGRVEERACPLRDAVRLSRQKVPPAPGACEGRSHIMVFGEGNRKAR